jgi:hypothetical protein
LTQIAVIGKILVIRLRSRHERKFVNYYLPIIFFYF